MMMLRGQCACGDARYEADVVSSRRRYCSCSLCRRAWGEAVVVGVEISAAALHWSAGDAVFYRASSHARQGVCANCGTVLCTLEQDGTISLNVSTMDGCAAIGVRSHVHASYRTEDAPLLAAM